MAKTGEICPMCRNPVPRGHPDSDLCRKCHDTKFTPAIARWKQAHPEAQ